MDPIVVKGLEKTYGDGTPAVRGIDFRVKKGEIFGLLGPNGAGKTTTMHILGTLHRASAGEARVLGLDPDRQAGMLRKRMGFAMQEVGMDDLATAREMLLFHAGLYGLDRRQARVRADELLDVFDLKEHAHRRVVRFSGGMQRRLDLAVSLVHHPEVLFLDEPSTGLDPKSRADLWNILRRLRAEQGLTILMSTHYMEEADALCDRIAIMTGGRIAAIDTPSALKRSVGHDTIRIAPSGRPTKKVLEAFARAVPGTRRDGKQIVVSVKDGSKQLLATLRAAATAGIDVASTEVHSPTLDDAFLHYTGASLEVDA